MVKDNRFNEDEISLAESALRQSIREWSESIDALKKKIEDANSLLLKLREFGGVTVSVPVRDWDSGFDIVVKIFQEAKKTWITSGYIVSQYRTKTGHDLTRNKLRRYLHASHSGISFEKQGDKRFTLWKLRKADSDK